MEEKIFKLWLQAEYDAGDKSCSDSDCATRLLSLEYRRVSNIVIHKLFRTLIRKRSEGIQLFIHAYLVSARFIAYYTFTFICTQHVSPFARAPTRTAFFALRRTSTFAIPKGCRRFLSKRNSLS